MHVTPFSAATILVFATASPLHAQGIEVFGGYSVNADYVQNRPAILVVDQKVSPFFSGDLIRVGRLSEFAGRDRPALQWPARAPPIQRTASPPSGGAVAPARAAIPARAQEPT